MTWHPTPPTRLSPYVFGVLVRIASCVFLTCSSVFYCFHRLLNKIFLRALVLVHLILNCSNANDVKLARDETKRLCEEICELRCLYRHCPVLRIRSHWSIVTLMKGFHGSFCTWESSTYNTYQKFVSHCAIAHVLLPMIQRNITHESLWVPQSTVKLTRTLDKLSTPSELSLHTSPL